MAARPVDDTDRRKVAELHAQGLSCAAIAREIGRARSTVSKIAAAAGLPFDRAQTRSATRAKVADAKARRAQLASDLLDDAQYLREKLRGPCYVYNFGGKDNTFSDAVAREPSPRDLREIMAAVGLAAERHERLVALDADQGLDDGKAMLTDLAEALGQAWRDGQAAPDDDA